MYSILYEDDCLFVVNKNAGMLVIPAKNEKKLCLLEILNKQAIREGKSFRLHPCHRIDRETSGIVIFAKGKKNQSLVMEQFKKRKVKKKYIAFVRGVLPKKQARLVHYIRARGLASGKASRQEAILDYRVLEQKKFWSLVNIEPVTGRMHQIRVQFARIGHPLLGERIYAFARDFEVKFRRLALHAEGISFSHPLKGKIISLSASLPLDMRKLLDN